MFRFTSALVFILFISLFVKGQNDNCATPTILCANNTIAGSNIGATTVASDPALDCGPSGPKATVWYTVTAISNGTATVTVSNVVNNPGLTVEAYTGTCGSFTTTGQCATGTGTLTITFATTTGTVYYIMVSGRGSNTETFNILATSSTNSIVARPDADFIANPTNGCIPLAVDLENTSIIFGGTNITYQWQFDGGSFVNSSGADTTVDYFTIGTHTVTFKVGNNECGSKSVSQDIVAQTVVASIGFAPSTTCVGTPVNFTGSAVVSPDTPYVDPNITSWSWNFGDPNSGTSDTSSLQNPTHTFVGPGISFNVQLIVQGVCGADTANLTVNILPKPVLHPSADQVICQGTTANLNVSVTNGTSPITYTWSGPPTITCSSCSSTTVTGLAVGGPYTYSISITDAHGCIADSSTHITVNPTPVVNAGNDTTVCKYTMLTLNPSVTTGNGPFTYAWTPSTGLNDSTLKNPTATITSSITYCVTVKDAAGCTSAPDCINISVYPKPTVVALPSMFCSSDPGPNVATLTVSGGHAGSTYQWKLSSNYSLIAGTNVDSSVITATVPTGVVFNYSFTVIVNDALTGCADTVTVTVPVIPGINLTVNGPFTICAGSSASLIASGGTTYAWTASPSYSFADSTQANQTVTPAVTTIFIVKGTQGTCSKTDSIFVTVHPKPVVNTGNDTTVCKYTMLTLNANVTAGTPPFTYAWSPSAGLNNPTQKNPTATITGPITYCVTVMDSIGCTSDTDCINISVYPKPSIASSHFPYCASDPGPDTTTLTVSGAHAGSVYSWKLSMNYSLITGTNIDSSSVKVTLPSGVPGTYNFTVIVNDPVTGCADTVSTSVTVVSGISMAVNGPFTICKGDSVMLTASGAAIYAWTAVPSYSFADSTKANQNVSPAVTTDFIVVGAIGTCIKVDTIRVTVNPIPVVSAGNDTTVCKYTMLTLNANVMAGTPPFTYAWSPSAGLSDSTKKNPTATITAPVTYCVTVKDLIGCTSAQSCINIDVYPKPTISSSHAPYCSSNPPPDTTTLTVSGAHAGSIYSWKLSPNYSLITGTNVDSSSVQVTLPNGVAGTDNFTVIVNDPVTGCADTVSTSVTVVIGVTTKVNGPFTICNGSSVLLTDSGATSYAWTASPHYVFVDSTQANQNVSPIVTTTFFVLGSTGSCSKLDSINVTVNPVPVAMADSISPFCGCATVTLNDSGSTPGMKYLWTSAKGSFIANPNAQVTTATVCQLDTFTLTVADTVTGCSKSVSIPVNSLPKPAAAANVTPPLICSGVSTTVTLNGTGSNTDIGTTYQWSSVPAVVIANPAALNTTATVSVSTVFSLTVRTAAGCDSVVTDTVNIYPQPTISVSPGNLCTSSPFMIDTVSVNGASPGSTYSWTAIPGCVTPSSTIAQSQAFNFSTCGVGHYSFTVVVTDAVSGCTTALNASVNVMSGVPLITSPSQAICEGDSVILFASGANKYLWSDGETTDTIVVKGLAASMSPDTFTVAGSIGSCVDIDTIIIIIHPKPIATPIIGPINVCQNDTVTIFSDSSQAGVIYVWTVTNGTVTSGQGTDSITVKWTGPGPATVSVHDSSSFGCISADQTLNVTVNPNPVTPAINGKDSVCANSTHIYSDSTIAGSTYQWSVSGGIISGSSTGDSISVIWGAGPVGTVQAVESNAAGCSGDTVSFNVTILPLPAKPAIVGRDTLCADSAGVIYSVTSHAGSSWLWTINGGSITTSVDSPQVTVTWGSAGTAVLTVEEINTNGCVSAIDTLNVTLDSIPVLTGIAGNLSVCPNDTSDIYIADTFVVGNIYTWAITGGVIASGQGTDTIKVNWGAAGAGTITVSEATPVGCAGIPQTINVTINPKPVTSAISGVSTACQNSMQQYSVDSTAGSTYQWFVTGGVITGSSTDTAVSVMWGAPPTGVVKVIETNASGCIGDTVILNVNILAAPALPVISGPDTLCANSSGIIDSVTNNAGSYYLWTVTVGTVVSPNDSTNQITVNWGSPAVDTVRVIEVNSNGCPSLPASLIVVLDSVPNTSVITGDTSSCANDTAVSYFVNNTPGNTYNWTVTGGIITSGQLTDSIKVNWTTEGTDTITVLETAPGGCSGLKQTLLVVVHHIPDSTRFSGKDTICAGSIITYMATGDSSSTFQWTATNGNIIGSTTGDTVSVQWPDSGSGFLQVVETSIYGCNGAPVFVNILINPLPNTSLITGNDTVCISDTGNVYLVTPTVGSTYAWSVAGGTITGGQGTDSITVNWNIAGADTVTVIETNSYGCQGHAVSIIVVVNAKPVANASASKITLCQNDTVQLTGTDSNAIGVNWYTNGSGTFDNDTSLTPIYTAGASDSGTIILTMMAHNPPCADDSVMIALTVNPVPHLAIMPSAPSVCIGDTDTLTVSGIGSFIWTPGNDSTSSIIVSPATTTTYTVTATNSYGCSSTDSVVVTVIPQGVATAGINQVICRGDSVFLNGSIANAGGGLWTSTGNGTFIPNAFTLNATYVPGSNDSTAFHLILTTTGACRNGSDTLSILVGAPPTVNAGPDQTISFNDSAQLAGITTNAGGIWSTNGSGTFIPSDTALNAIYVPSYTDLQQDSIILTLTTTHGCRTISAFMVIHFSEFMIPNVFTPYPNSPGYNDFFEMKGLPPGSKLKVWNRWGLLVYESDDYRNDWDAADVVSDTYYYIVTTTSKEYHGWVKVIK